MSIINILMKPLLPKSMNVEQYGVTILAQLGKEAEQVDKLYQKTYNTWKKKPAFKTSSQLISGGAEAIVSTKDKKFIYLEKGTSKRWAVMSNPYITKTRAHVLGSRPGRGRTVVRGSRAMRGKAMPGIKAREFSAEIIKRRSPIFLRGMRRTIRLAAERTF